MRKLADLQPAPAKAGVGLRTFYRYFPSKEWIACHGVFRLAVEGVEAVGRRPASEHPDRGHPCAAGRRLRANDESIWDLARQALEELRPAVAH